MANTLDNPNAWDNVSEGYNNLITGAFRELNEKLLVPFPKASRCLDLCCGAGAASLALADKFDRVDAVDFSEGMLEQLEHNMRLENISNVYPQQGNALKIAEMFPSESFDVVWSSFGVFLIPAYQDVFKAVLRILKPSGTFLFTGFPRYDETPFHKALFEACHAAKNDYPLPKYSEEGLHDPKFVENTLAALGFEKTRAEMHTIPFHVSDVESFWTDLENANIQFGPLRDSLGEEGWRDFSKNAQDYLKANHSFPCSLDMVSIVGQGEKI